MKSVFWHSFFVIQVVFEWLNNRELGTLICMRKRCRISNTTISKYKPKKSESNVICHTNCETPELS